MTKSLGDYNIERSSSSDTKNISWSQKMPADAEQQKKKKPRKTSKNTSATNIIYTDVESEPHVEKTFIIEKIMDADKSKNKNLDRRFENTSASIGNIQQGFRRPAR
ncbi:MAG: hypothetical protein GKS07_10575 [Nitrosopumilus sp.]|nr:MAG: hypothetical protein GKS07_10575 [Nitrosopumilus sp.]